MNKELQEEKEYLKYVRDLFQKIQKDSKTIIDKLPEIYKDDPLMLYNLSTLYGSKMVSLERNYDKPYFARIDFKEDGKEKINKCYLGKVGTTDDNNEIATVDWRAPIASIYYDSSIGKASYEAPDGNIQGELLLKRQYDIEKGELIDFRNVDIVSDDEILAPYLSVNADNRLKNIVASIQSEQNEIIREKINKNLIIQGVAGSGKTTVALHRIAYLVYNYINDIKPEQFLVVGPNKFFVNYISNVLPDLDVNNVLQLTYDEVVKKYTKENFTFLPTEDKLIKSISTPDKMFFEKLRTSMLYKKAIDKYIEDYVAEFFGYNDLETNGYKVIDGKIIMNMYQGLKYDILYKDNINKQIERITLLTSKYIEDNKNRIQSYLWSQYRDKINGLSLEEQKHEMERYNKAKNEVEKKCKASLKKYFSKRSQKVLPLYADFLKNIDKYIIVDDFDITPSIKECISNINKKKVEFEDLAALMYIKYKLDDTHNLDSIRHIAIDEAQDFGEFNFYALKQTSPKATFSIFGDLAQSIYQYRDINDWQDVIETSFNGNCDLKYMLKSYRTTAEIMNSANNIIKHINMKTAQPVIRHGAAVEYKKENNDLMDLIAEYIVDSHNKNYKSAAIITKTEEEAIQINKKLQKLDFEIENITSKNTKYVGGFCTIPCYLAKGLEFDSVFISDASEDKYNSEKIIDMKLLYVAMTRALHELKIAYSGEINKALTEEVIKSKERNR